MLFLLIDASPRKLNLTNGWWCCNRLPVCRPPVAQVYIFVRTNEFPPADIASRKPAICQMPDTVFPKSRVAFCFEQCTKPARERAASAVISSAASRSARNEHQVWQKCSNFWPQISRQVGTRTVGRRQTLWLRIFSAAGAKMKKNALRYELYGSSAASGRKGYWRWAIFAGREKKPLLVGSYYGAFDDAKAHAEEAILRLKERAQKSKVPSKK